MPKMAKASSRSALYFYALDCKRKQNLNGDIRQVIEIVYNDWKGLSTLEKLPYEEEYAQWKLRLKNERIEIPIFSGKMKQEIKTEADIIQEKKTNTVQLLNKMCSEAPGTNKIDFFARKKWYFVKFLSFCKSDANPYPEVYYNPYYVLAEVGLVEYSLQDGITNQYHSFIKTTKIPLGYRSACMDESKANDIPLENKEATKSHAQIYSEIRQFISDPDPIVFSAQNCIEETTFGLEFLKNEFNANNSYGERYNDQPEIYEIENLIIVLAQNALQPFELNFHVAGEILNKTVFDYADDTRCYFHDTTDTTKCALAYVKRYAYQISDSVCQLYSIDLTTQHIPTEKPVGTVIPAESTYRKNTFTSSRLSSASNSSINIKEASSKFYSYEKRGDPGINNLDKPKHVVEEDLDDFEDFFDNTTTISAITNAESRASTVNASVNSHMDTSEKIVQQKLTNQPAKRILKVSDKFESSLSNVATNGSIISTAASKFSTNISTINSMETASNYSQRNIEEVCEDDDEEQSGWVDHHEIEERKRMAKKGRIDDNTDAQSVVSEATRIETASTIMSETSSLSNVKTFMGRGRGLVSRR